MTGIYSPQNDLGLSTITPDQVEALISSLPPELKTQARQIDPSIVANIIHGFTSIPTAGPAPVYDHFDIHGNHYYLPPRSPHLVDNYNKPYTLAAFLKKEFPALFKSYCFVPQLPDFFDDLTETSCLKALRALQLHECEPPITAETRLITPILRGICNQGIYTYTTRQFSTALWAANYDEDLAASVLLYYGTATLPRYAISKITIHTLEILDDGLRIEVPEHHTLTDRYEAAIEEIRLTYNFLSSVGAPLSRAALVAAGTKKLFWYKQTLIALPVKIRDMTISLIHNYVDSLLIAWDRIPPLKPAEPLPPIDFPYAAPGVLFFPYEDIVLKIPGASEATIAHNRQVQRNTSENNFYSKYYPQMPHNKEMHRDEIIKYFNNSSRLLTNAVKFGFIERPRRGYYLVPERR